MQKVEITTYNAEQTIAVGRMFGAALKGSEVIECKSDLGGGKTTFVKGLAEGFGSNDPVASPSFTISFVYTRSDGKQLHHFDFYRLDDPGVVANELAEVEGDEDVVTVIEWGEIVHDVLPAARIILEIKNISEEQRLLNFRIPEQNAYLYERLKSMGLNT